MLKRMVFEETEFNNTNLQDWISTEYKGHSHNLDSLIERLRKDGFVIKGDEGRLEILNAVNALIELGVILVTKIKTDAALQIFDCQFRVQE